MKCKQITDDKTHAQRKVSGYSKRMVGEKQIQPQAPVNANCALCGCAALIDCDINRLHVSEPRNCPVLVPTPTHLDCNKCQDSPYSRHCCSFLALRSLKSLSLPQIAPPYRGSGCGKTTSFRRPSFKKVGALSRHITRLVKIRVQS